MQGFALYVHHPDADVYVCGLQSPPTCVYKCSNMCPVVTIHRGERGREGSEWYARVENLLSRAELSLSLSIFCTTTEKFPCLQALLTHAEQVSTFIGSKVTVSYDLHWFSYETQREKLLHCTPSEMH